MAACRRSSAIRIAVAAAAVLTLLFVALPPLANRAVARQPEMVRISPGSTVALATPIFLVPGKRYAFTWPGGGPPQTHTLKRVHENGWVEVEVADENIDPSLLVPGQLPTRWLNAALALSIQEMRPLP
jgi:hypothetical protein